MQFNKNTSLGKTNIIGLIIKFIIGLTVILGLVFLINKIDFPTPKKEVEKIIPNENFKIVK
jgi:predicted RND superfamily exporter protein